MSAADPYSRHYSYPLVTWGSTLLGAVVAVITSVMLNLLGAAAGIATAAAGGGATAGIGSLVWLVVANLVALGFGAWVAGRSTANPDHHGGTLQGVAVWAVTSLAVIAIAGSALSGISGVLMQGAGAAANASSGAIAEQADRSDSAQRVQAAADQARASMVQNQAAIASAATKVAGATAAASLGGFLAMLFGLGAAVVGARLGARHPNWADRPRYTVVERTHR